jgi:hypothetical protein
MDNYKYHLSQDKKKSFAFLDGVVCFAISKIVRTIVIIEETVTMVLAIVMIHILVNFVKKLVVHFNVITMVNAIKENAFVMKDTV